MFYTAFCTTWRHVGHVFISPLLAHIWNHCRMQDSWNLCAWWHGSETSGWPTCPSSTHIAHASTYCSTTMLCSSGCCSPTGSQHNKNSEQYAPVHVPQAHAASPTPRAHDVAALPTPRAHEATALPLHSTQLHTDSWVQRVQLMTAAPVHSVQLQSVDHVP